MGKVKRTKGSKLEIVNQGKNVPLSEQILDDPTVRPVGRTKIRNRKEDDEVGSFMKET